MEPNIGDTLARKFVNKIFKIAQSGHDPHATCVCIICLNQI